MLFYFLRLLLVHRGQFVPGKFFSAEQLIELSVDGLRVTMLRTNNVIIQVATVATACQSNVPGLTSSQSAT